MKKKMLGIMKLDSREVANRPWDIVERIEKIIRGKESNRVRIRVVHTTGSLIHFPLVGVSIETTNLITYKSVHRRVKVIFTKDRTYEIDLDKIKAKYEEVKKLAKEFEKDKKKADENKEGNEKLILKLKDGIDNIDISIEGSKDCFNVKIYVLKEEEVKKVVEFVKNFEKEVKT